MGVYRSTPETRKQTKTGTNKNVKFTSCEMQGWRKNMEDARIADLQVKVGNKTYSVFGVFDGHGGPEVSKFCEKYFVKQFSKNEQLHKGDVGLALQQTFRKMDEMLSSPDGSRELNEIRKNLGQMGAAGQDDNISCNAGCTANVLVFDDQHYYVANAGDSRCALSRSGKLVVLSEDHKPECPIEKSRIEKAGGMIMNGRVNGGLNLTRAIGDFEYKRVSNLNYKDQMITCHPDVKKIPRSADDEYVIMGCDGIWQRYVNDSQQMLEYVAELRKKHGKESGKLMEELLDNLLAKSTLEEVGCDNMTAILIEFNKN